jgi:hypothetical protein
MRALLVWILWLTVFNHTLIISGRDHNHAGQGNEKINGDLDQFWGSLDTYLLCALILRFSYV